LRNLLIVLQKLPFGIGDYFDRSIPPSDNVSLLREYPYQ